MTPLTDRDRDALTTARRHLREAGAALLRTDRARSVSHMRTLIASFVASITDEIGPETEADRDLDAEDDDGWYTLRRGDCRAAYRPSPIRQLDDLLGRASVNPDGLSPRDRAALESAFHGAAEYSLDFTQGPKADPMPDEKAARFEDCGRVATDTETIEARNHSPWECGA